MDVVASIITYSFLGVIALAILALIVLKVKTHFKRKKESERLQHISDQTNNKENK